MYIYIYICIYMCIYTYVYAYICIYTYIYTYCRHYVHLYMLTMDNPMGPRPAFTLHLKVHADLHLRLQRGDAGGPGMHLQLYLGRPESWVGAAEAMGESTAESTRDI